MARVFISHSSKDSRFVQSVLVPLLKSGDIDTWFSPEDVRTADDWHRRIVLALRSCDWFLVVLSANAVASEWVRAEVHWAMENRRNRIVPVLLAECDSDDLHLKLRQIQYVDFRHEHKDTRAALLSILGGQSVRAAVGQNENDSAGDGQVGGRFATSERAVVDMILRQAHEPGSKQPPSWPEPTSCPFRHSIVNKLYVAGQPGESKRPAQLLLDANLSECSDRADAVIRFARAMCHERIPYYALESNRLNVAILVSGGVVPGTNTVIDAVVQRQSRYAIEHGHGSELRIYGFNSGFKAFDDYHSSYSLLTPSEKGFESEVVTSRFVDKGGSILGTSHVPWLEDGREAPSRLAGIARMLRDELISILYIIGGDRSMKAAHALSLIATNAEEGRSLAILGIPQSIHNDILWVSQSLGSITTAEQAQGIIQQLHVEVRSNPRICIIQLPGAGSGYLACQAVMRSRGGECDAVLIPEVPYTVAGLFRHLGHRLKACGYALVVMAEGAVPLDAAEFLDRSDPEFSLSIEEQEAIRGFTARCQKEAPGSRVADALRSAAPKIVSRGLRLHARASDPGSAGTRVFVNEPRHLLRAIKPSNSDIEMAQRLATAAVDAAMAGYTDVMVANWRDETIVVPLELTAVGIRQVDKSSNLWRSILAKTRQPEKMT